MTGRTLIVRSLWHHRWTHAGVVAAAATAGAVLVGALLLGDSVRFTLGDLAMLRLGRTELALGGGDRFFRAALADSLASDLGADAAPVLALQGLAGLPDRTERLGVQVLGVDDRFWRLAPDPVGLSLRPDEVILNDHLARRLNVTVGQKVLVRADKPGRLSRDVSLSSATDVSARMLLTIREIVDDRQFGRFSLRANQAAPLNVFVSLAAVSKQIGRPGRANLMLLAGRDGNAIDPDRAGAALRRNWELADAELELRPLPKAGRIELRSTRIFLDPSVADAAAGARPGAEGILTYFVNEIRHGDRATPYSMVSAMGPLRRVTQGQVAREAGPPIRINKWLAEDLAARKGDTVEIRYFALSPGRRLIEKTQAFLVDEVMATNETPRADRTLMPEFPGLSDAENCRDWDSSLPVDLKRIRDKDERYWDRYRGTPKAFVSLGVGRQLWSNRFGDLTAVRFPTAGGDDAQSIAAAIRDRLEPVAVGLSFQPVRRLAIAAGAQSLDLGQYFLAMSMFLIVAALLLTGLLFGFGVDRRGEQIGTLLALGFTPGRVRRLLLAEGAVLAAVGALAGLLGGVICTRAMLLALATVWRGVSTGSAISYHARASTLAIGAVPAFCAALASMWVALRRQVRRPARELLASAGEPIASDASVRRTWPTRGVMVLAAVGAAGIVLTAAAGGHGAMAAAFFGAGALVLVAMLAGCALSLAAMGRPGRSVRPSVTMLARRHAGRRPRRSLVVAALLACGSFMVIATGAFHLGAVQPPEGRPSGTGGFDLVGLSSLPVFEDPGAPGARVARSLREGGLGDVEIVPLRISEGDDASCLNLNRTGRPQLLGVDPARLTAPGRGGFVFRKEAPGPEVLGVRDGSGVVNAIGDETTIVWGLGKRAGDVIEYVDEKSRPLRVRIAAVMGNSVLQGSLLISEQDFLRHFPSAEGYRMFLIDAPPGRAEQAGRVLGSALKDIGLSLTSASERLAEFHVVQNTYLSIFQALGLLGMLLGSVGLGVVVLRNAIERRRELAILRAVGFSRSTLRRMLFWEHWMLSGTGLAVGAVAAVVAVIPVQAGPDSRAPLWMMIVTLVAIQAGGALWTLAGAALASRGTLIDALREE